MADLETKLKEAVAAFEAMSPEDRRAMIEAQKRSYVIAEAGFGSDADEAAYRAAAESDDPERIAAEEAKAQARMRAAREYLDGRDA